ncbi:MAG: hypothetical protein AAGC63_15100 [Propionicimonas sp.]|nr:hypothetical protein [Propionicimonas sp.]
MLVLTEAATIVVPPVLGELCLVQVSGLSVTATIDTRRMGSRTT